MKLVVNWELSFCKKAQRKAFGGYTEGEIAVSGLILK